MYVQEMTYEQIWDHLSRSLLLEFKDPVSMKDNKGRTIDLITGALLVYDQSRHGKLTLTTDEAILEAEKIYASATRFGKDHCILGVQLTSSDFGVMLALPMTNNEVEYATDWKDDRDGVFCYVYNLTYTELSELGYCSFGKAKEGYIRTA